MPRPAYQLPPLDPAKEITEVRARPSLVLNLNEAFTEVYMMGMGAARGPPFRVKGPGYLYDFTPQGGPKVYSPNCLRPDLLPPGPRVDYLTDVVLKGRDYDLPHFSQPQYWTRAQSYFAFLPRTPINVLLPTFACLRRSPAVRQSPNSKLFHPHTICWGDWTDLEKKVVSACNTLRRCAGLPSVYPAWPSARVRTKKYSDEVELEQDLSKAKDWFHVWLGIIAYNVAALLMIKSDMQAMGLTRVVPPWMDILLNPPNPGDEPLDEVFVTDISQSVCHFDGAIARVGTFIVIPEDYDPQMVSTDWLISLDIPVFWEWTAREVEIARTKPYFRRFEPPSDAVDVFKVMSKPHPPYPLRNMDVDPAKQPLTSQVHDMDVDLQLQSSHSGPSTQPNFDSSSEASPSVPITQTQTDSPPSASLYTLSRSNFRRRPDPTEAQLVNWRRAESMRKEAALRLEALETSQSRAVRLAREKNPPTRRGKVTMWVWSLDNDGIYKADKVDGEDMGDMFSSESPYSRDQAIYDSFSAKWHIADFLGRPTDYQLEHMASNYADYHGTPYMLEIKLLRVWYGLDEIPVESPQEMKLRLLAEGDKSQEARGGKGVAEVQADHPKLNISEEPMETDPSGALVPDTIEVLSGTRDKSEASAYLLYGYLVPSLDITPVQPPSTNARAVVGFLLGLRSFTSHSLSSPYWETVQGRSLGSFANALLDKDLFASIVATESHPTNLNFVLDLNWDFGSLCRHSVQRLDQFKWLQRVKAEFVEECSNWDNVDGLLTSDISQVTQVYLFGNPSKRGWYLGTSSSVVALHICRLDNNMDPNDMARDLLGRGFRFFTFSPVSSIPKHVPFPNNNLKRYRPDGHQWTEADYDSWVGAVKTFLRSNRGRAAYMRGGIVWRIAMEFGLPDDVLFGPSDKAKQGLGLIRQDSSKNYFVDDSLSAEEIDFLCGVHYVYMKGTPKKAATISTPSAKDNAQAGPSSLPPSTPQQQLQRFSYFPPEDLWVDMYGLFNGWPEDAEVKFKKDRDALPERWLHPIPRATWRRRLKKPGSLSTIAYRLEKTADLAIISAGHSFDFTL